MIPARARFREDAQECAELIERLRGAVNLLLVNMKADGGEYRDCYVKAKALIGSQGAA